MAVINDKERLPPVRVKHYTQHNPIKEPYLFWLAVMQNSELDQVQKIIILMTNNMEFGIPPEVTA